LATDGGMETWLIFEKGFELPCFASFPLLESGEGREALTAYFDPYLALARQHGIGFVLEGTTWRANPAWAERLGYSLGALADANRRSIAYQEEIRVREDAPGRPFAISGTIGPESDAYNPGHRLTAAEAEAFHSWQIGVLAETAADLVTAFTIGYTDEAIGIVRAAVAAGIPAAISFTVETDGRLPSGQPLANAIEEVDAETDGATAY
jgi:homocysteine S-methyltransferase